MNGNVKIYIIGSMSQADTIKAIGEHLNTLDYYDVRYVQPQPQKYLSNLILECYENIQWADRIFAITKPDGSVGEGVTYEIMYAHTLEKTVLNVKPGWNDVRYDSYQLHGDALPPDGMWVDWKDSAGNIERARLKYDDIDDFSPTTKIIQVKNVVAWRLPRN